MAFEVPELAVDGPRGDAWTGSEANGIEGDDAPVEVHSRVGVTVSEADCDSGAGAAPADLDGAVVEDFDARHGVHVAGAGEVLEERAKGISARSRPAISKSETSRVLPCLGIVLDVIPELAPFCPGRCRMVALSRWIGTEANPAVADLDLLAVDGKAPFDERKHHGVLEEPLGLDVLEVRPARVDRAVLSDVHLDLKDVAASGVAEHE